MKLFKEFKEFINRGNVLDLAVAVVIGGAFGKIVTALVNNVIMPAISMIFGASSIAELAIVKGEGDDAIVLAYGAFIQAIIDFIIVAFVIFLVVKAFNKMKRKKEEEPAPEPDPEPSAEEKLLTEIRDLIKEK